MNTRLSLRSSLTAFTLLVLTAGVAMAWPGESFTRIEISGPGIMGVTSITDPDLLKPMTIEGFMNFEEWTLEPEYLGAGYELHRYFRNPDGTEWDFDRIRYHADPAGGPGFVYYLEGIGYSPAHNAGKWFRVTPEGEAAMQRILSSLGLSAAGTAPEAASTPQPAPWAVLVVMLGGFMLLAGLAARRVTRPAPAGSSSR